MDLYSSSGEGKETQIIGWPLRRSLPQSLDLKMEVHPASETLHFLDV
jgi:hypothetical protein